LANVAYTILIPFVPTLQSRFGMGATAVGLAFGGFAAAKALSQPLGGWSVDRLRARTVAVAGLAVAAAATVALAAAGNAGSVIGCRLLWGLGEGFAIPALYRLASALGDRSHFGQARVLGWFGCASVIGMTLGPGVVALFSHLLTFQVAFLLGGLLTATAAAVLRYTVDPELGRDPSGGPHPHETAGVAVTGRRLMMLLVIGFGLLDFVNNFVYAALEPVLPLYATETIGVDTRTVSILFFVGLAAFAAVSAAGGPVVQRYGERTAAAVSLAVQAVALTAAGLVATVEGLAVSFFLLMVFQPLVYVAARSAISSIASAHQGKAFGLFGLISDLGWIAGPVLASAALATVHGNVMFLLAALAAVAAVGALALPRTRATAPAPPDAAAGGPAADPVLDLDTRTV
jgi:MFS family permease